jgi:transcriptional regulator with XRE-family HTH domain
MQKEKPDQFLYDVGLKISEIREEMGYTQTDLADKLGVSMHMVQYWERGSNLTLKTLWRFSDALGCQETDFLEKPRKIKKGPGRPVHKRKKSSKA